MDASKLTTEQLDKLIAAGGDLSKITSEDLNSIITALEPSATDKAIEAGAEGLSAVGKTLDYLGGVTRTALGAAASDKIGLGDVGQALAANPLSGSQILERFGVPESGKLSDALPSLYSETGEGLALKRGGGLDPTGRGAAGLVLETITDPVTYTGIGGLLGLVGRGTKGTGRGLYNWAFKAADIEAKRFGKGVNEVADLARRYKITGSAEEIADKMQQIASDLVKEQQKILTRSSALGANVDVEKALKPVMEEAEKLTKSGRALPIRQDAQKVLDVLKDLAERNKVSEVNKVLPDAAEASRLKSDIYSLLKKDDWKSIAQTDAETGLLKGAGSALKEAVEQSTKKVSPEFAGALKQTNKDLGILATVSNVMDREAAKEIMRNALTPVDTALLAASPGVAIGKKLGDITKGATFKTKGGALLEKLGDIGIAGGQILPRRRVGIPVKAGVSATQRAQDEGEE